MKRLKRILVVIINYNTPELTMNCIRTLRTQLDWEQDHIVVVDNKSCGNDIEKISNYLHREQLTGLVSLIAATYNNGFSSGNNIGVNAFDSAYYLLANSDTFFRSGAISNLLLAALQYPDAGIISPRLEWPHGEPQISCFRSHSPLYELIYSAGTGVITKLLFKFNVPLPISDFPMKPEWTSFACVLIRRELFDRIGLLDEGYFMYYEDVDFCQRARQAGFDILNWPKAHVVHLRGQSSGIKKLKKDNKRMPAYFYRSRSRYYIKYFGYLGYIASNIFWLIGRSISFLREILFSKTRTVPNGQFFDIWK